MKVLVIPNPAIMADLSPEHGQWIREAGGNECEVVVAKTEEEQLHHARDAEFVLGHLSREAFLAAHRLQWVHAMATGADRMLFPEMRNSDIPLISNKALTGTQLADHAFALLLALTRGIAIAARLGRRLDNQQSFRRDLVELDGLTMGILGLGGTGLATARRADGFGMRVIAVNPSPKPKPAFVAELWGSDRFSEFLGESDVVTICCPLTPATRGLFNLQAFQQMKPSAFIINVTRGPIIEHTALVEALQSGLIAGAGLDDLPQDPQSPLWDMVNVVITPHIAGGSPLSAGRCVRRFCENLQRWQRGEPLEGLVDKVKGY